MGIKKFFSKVWGGIKKAGRFVKDKVFPIVGRIAKPILGVLSALPGKLGLIGNIGSAAANVLHNVTNSIPNENAKQKINDFIANNNEKFQNVVDRGKNFSERVNNNIDQVKKTYEDIKRDPNFNKLKQNIRLLPVDIASKIDV